MPTLTVGWSLGRELSDSDVQRFVGDLKLRYAPFYADPLEHRVVRSRHRGTACIAPGLSADARVIATKGFIASMHGSPSLISDQAGVRAGKLTAADMVRLTGCRDGIVERTDVVNPPFSLVWMDVEKDQLGASVDGLGMQQLFHFSDGVDTVVSSKIWPILRLLALRPEADEHAWRHWFVRGWFYGNESGFSRIDVLAPGSTLTCDAAASSVRHIPVVGKWIGARDSLSDGQLMDQAVESFRGLILSHQDGSDGSVSDLTGGVDTRAIAAAIASGGRRCSFTTSGSALSHDVIIARKVAGRLGLPWTHDTSSELSGDLSSWQSVLDCFRRMIIWSEGAVEPNRFEHFGSEPETARPETHFYGAEAGISKGALYRARILNNPEALADTVIEKFLGAISTTEATLLTSHGDRSVTERVREDLAVGRQIGLRGFELLDFNFLYSRVRRWVSAHRAANRFDNRVAPFMNIGHIGLAYALTPAAKSKSVYQHAIICRFAPELNTLPINQQLYLSRIWRWLPHLRRVEFLSRRFASPSAIDQVRSLSRDYLKQLLRSDSPVFSFINREAARKNCDVFLRGGDSTYYFVLRLISFDVWHSEYFGTDVGTG